jgi:hypothetical protein
MSKEHVPIRATIIRKGRCREDGYTEPYARFEDGREMPMGWNAMGPIFEVGTEGTAQYVRTSSAGLWKFTPYRTDGSAVYCPECGAKFGGMTYCPWDRSLLLPLADAHPTAVAFYAAIRDPEEPPEAAKPGD